MTYEEAVKTIDSLLVFGSKPGLERVKELVERIGAPDQQLKFVHVAGTNGKGSVCAYVSSILKSAGYKTGLFISPYVLEFRERFQINGEMIPYDTLAALVEEIYPVVLAMKDEGKIITEFEMVLAVALQWYAREQCDIVVLETGLGGRFDATNIIDTPLASVIMSISLDHTAILGDTVEKIAFEKCGIIKEGGTTVLYGDQPEGVLPVVQQTAKERHNTLLIADTEPITLVSSGLEGSTFTIQSDIVTNGAEMTYTTPLIGAHQINNAAAALYTVAALRQKGIMIPETAVQQGLAQTKFPARLELLQKEPVILLDGAHNPGGAAALSKAIREHLSGQRKVAVMGMLADKDVDTVLSQLAPLFDRVVTVAPPNPRAMTAADLAKRMAAYGIPAEAQEDYSAAFRKAKAYAAAYDPPAAIVICGSLYMASEMRQTFMLCAEKGM